MALAISDIFMFGGAFLAGFMVCLSLIRDRLSRADTTEPRETPTIFLFNGERLCDMTPMARDYLAVPVDCIADLEEMLTATFPDLSFADIDPQGISRSDPTGRLRLTARQDGAVLRVEVWGLPDIIMARRARELTLLADIARHSGELVWQIADNGRLIWSNSTYRRIASEIPHGDGGLFPDLDPAEPHQSRRLQPKACSTRWFDVTTAPSEDGLICFATETTEIVRADDNRREYVKTLGRTFGDLATGLAIFDKAGQLKMFNPALLEMSKLPFAFLSAMPRIDTVLDRMRELQMMPEPKDYATWREQFTAVESGARRGTYCENWPLPDGQTFRVTGRPHPDGAFALLFEDITAELSLTRRFRAEIETGQAVMDSLPDAIAVFSPAGTLLMTNRGYSDLWGIEDPHLSLRDLITEVSLWRENAVTSSVWSRFQTFARQGSDRKAWTGDVHLLDGRPLRCHGTPLDGGMTLMRFSFAPPTPPLIQKLMQADPAIRARSG